MRWGRAFLAQLASPPGRPHTWFKVCSGPIYHGLSTPDDRCVGRHGTPSTRTHRPASAGAAGGHHKAPGWGGLSSQPKKAHICRQSSSFARRQAVARPTKAGLSHGRGTAASFVRHGRPESAGTASEAVHGEWQGLCGAAKRAEFSRSSIAGVRRSLLAGYLLGGVPRAYYVTV